MLEPIERLVLRDARVVDPSQGLDAVASVFVERGQIAVVARSESERNQAEHGAFAGARTYDAQGLILLPGLIDLRAHLGQPGYEYKEDVRSGLSAAMAGGYVGVCCLPDTAPINDNRAVTDSLRQASSDVGPELLPIAAVTRGMKGEVLSEIGDLKEGGAVAVSDVGRYLQRADVMRRALQYCRTFDLPLMQQPQEPTLIQGGQMHEGSVSTRLGLRGWPRPA